MTTSATILADSGVSSSCTGSRHRRRGRRHARNQVARQCTEQER